MIPNAQKYDPSPEYLRGLIARSGLTQAAVADQIGISHRLIRYYISQDPQAYRPAPYMVQFALEVLAGHRPRQRTVTTAGRG